MRMRARDLHPLCCLPVDCPGGWCADRSPSPPPPAPAPAAVAGLLHKWTNIGKGWRPRWFAILRGGLLAYSKIRPRAAGSPTPPPAPEDGGAPRLIGPAGYAAAAEDRPIGLVHLKISSFRESKSDDKRFYIITPTKTLQLRTNSVKDRVAWIEALVSARSESSPSGVLLYDQNDASFSTDRLRNRMHAEGLGEEVIKDCEQIVHSEFLQYYTQMKQRCEEYLSFLGSLPQQLEVLNAQDTTHSNRPDCSCSGHGKCCESSNTESSDDAGIQELDESSDEDDYTFCDTRQSFSDSAASPDLRMKCSNSSNDIHQYDHKFAESRSGKGDNEYLLLPTKRRTKLPEPVEKEKGVSLWSMIKDNVGKDLTRVCLPVYFNEPISSLQKCFEDLEYSQLLDRAHDYGLKGNSVMRTLCVAAFAVSGYASSDGRPCKPFNPLLGETYEADFPENGIRFFSEKVSHHPMVMACHCEGRGWKFWGESNVKSKFWGQTIQLDPVGVLTLEFDDGEIFKWSKVQGVVEDIGGTKVATLRGKWDESLYCNVTNDGVNSSAESTLLWEKHEPPTNPTRYNLSSFAITLNELTPNLKEKLPPTDSRLRPDQRHLENGEYDKANSEKLRLETRQRMARKMQDNGWKPRWFDRDTEDGAFRYTGGYWDAREQRKWDGCRDIFGELPDKKTSPVLASVDI